jgi:hypothetical protein
MLSMIPISIKRLHVRFCKFVSANTVAHVGGGVGFFGPTATGLPAKEMLMK